MDTEDSYEELTIEIKKQLLSIATIDVIMRRKKSLNGSHEHNAFSRHVLEGSQKKIYNHV
jgi:CRISPR-associated protein Cas1